MKVLLINDDKDQKNLGYYIGQLPRGHYATVQVMSPKENVPAQTTANYIVIDIADKTERVSLANRLADEFQEITTILVDNGNVQPEHPHNLVIVSRITQAAEYIHNNDF